MNDANTSQAFQELMAIRGLGEPESTYIDGNDPVLSTRFPLGETAAAVMAGVGVAVTDLWERKHGSRQTVSVAAAHAAAALKSYAFMRLAGDDGNPFGNARRAGLTNPMPTRDGRFFLPHFGMPHLAERVCGVLGCPLEPDAVIKAIAARDALELEDAVAEVNACGAMVRSNSEWLAHPHGQILATRPVVTITRIGNGPPTPLPAIGKASADGDRPLAGIRALDLTRVLAGPTCARTLAEHGADVLMVAGKQLPQVDRFVMDTGHGKRSSFLDLDTADGRDGLMGLVADADIFSQGYRPGVLAKRGFGPEQLAEARPGIIYTSMSCYGSGGPFSNRAGWEQLAQTVTGVAFEHGDPTPALLPAAACDYMTGYLAAFGTLIALNRRASEGGSWHVEASLCQSGMFLHRQHRVDFDAPNMDVDPERINEIIMTSDTRFGEMTHLGPILSLSETPPHWSSPTVPLGTHEPVWLPV
jgi:crotonobetainyl-CoA:carnitine CoA-transferase CaiB-like acyl-CoA transferase